MAGRFLSELTRRRIPQVAGIYLAAAWGLLEFTQWATAQFEFPPNLVLWTAGILGIAFPISMVLAWRSGSRQLTLPDHPPITSGPGPPPRSIAVLPFSDITPESPEPYLGPGLAEEILHTLASVPGLKVASRTSSFAFQDTPMDIREIGQRLNVGAVLEGSVRRSESSIVVSTQLVNVGDGYQIWSRRFDREMEDVFAIQREIARDVARVLEVMLAGDAGRPLTHDIRAYEFYLRGQHHLRKTRRRHLLFARDLFTHAVELDPGFALAWAGIAESISVLSMFYPSARVDLNEAEAASDKAIALAPGRPEGHTTHGVVRFLQGDLSGANEDFGHALELDPDHFEAHYFQGRAHFQAGEYEEAAELFGRAASVEPEDYQAAFFRAQSLEAQGRHLDAMEGYRQSLEAAETFMELHPEDPRAATMRAVSLGRLGRAEDGLIWARRALELDPEDAGVRYNVACLFAIEGRLDEALECLSGALSLGFGNRAWLARDPDLQNLREDPRFKILLEDVQAPENREP